MNITKYIPKIVLSITLVFGLSSGFVASAVPLGSKEELAIELKSAEKTQGTSDKEPALQHANISKPKTAPKTAGNKSWAETMKKIIGKPAKTAVAGKKAVPVKAPSVKRMAAKKEVIRGPATIEQTIDYSDKVGGVANRWFGLETGTESIRARAGTDTQILQSEKGDSILTLKDCIDIAIKNNPPLQIAVRSVKLAEMRVIEARRNMLPTVTVAFEPYTGKVNDRNYVGRKQYIEGKQPLYRGGELYFTLKQAETNLEITRNEGSKIKNELVLQVKKAYYALVKAENNMRMQAELSGEVDCITQMVSDEYDANVASKLEFLNVSSQASQIKYQLASADGDVSIAELILKQSMNVEPEARIRVAPKLDFNRMKVKYDDALAAALVNRPEVRINLLMLDYYSYGKKIAASKNSPKIDLMGSWGLAKEEYMPIDNSWGDTTGNPAGTNGPVSPDMKLEQQWYAGVKTSVPFWGSTAEYSWTREQWTPVISAYQGTEATTNSFKFKVLDNLSAFSEKQLSEIDSDRARQEYNKMKQDITLEVKEQCFSYEKALIQLDTALSKVKYQENDFEFVKMKRSLDEVADSGVIESMIKLSQEKFGYVQALTDCHTVVASINKAIGIEDFYNDE